MIMYKCSRCGCVFSEDDADTRSERVGEFWGAPAYTEILICPDCGYDELDRATEDDIEQIE